MLTETVSGIYHVLGVFHGSCQRLLTDDIAACVHGLDGNVMMQEVGHAYIHQVAVTFCDGGVDVIIRGITCEAVAVCQSGNAAQVLIANTDDLNFIQDAAVAIRMQVGREGRAD